MDIVHSPIEQRNTGKGNPNAMLHFDRPLNNRQQRILDRLSEYDSRTLVSRNAINLHDLSALTAKTNDEFALFTRRGERLIVRGNSRKTNIDAEMARQMAAKGWRWSAHTHPGTDYFCLFPSDGDKAVLRAFGQRRSCIVNSVGMWNTFEEGE